MTTNALMELADFEKWARKEFSRRPPSDFDRNDGTPPNRLGLEWEYNGDAVQVAWAAWIERSQLRTAAAEGGEAACFIDPADLELLTRPKIKGEPCKAFADVFYQPIGQATVPLYTHPSPEVARDAERYRYLRQNCVRQWVSDMEDDKGAPSLDICFEAEGHDLDAALDVATGGLRISAQRSFAGGFEQRAIKEREGESDDYIRGHYDGRKLGREESFKANMQPQPSISSDGRDAERLDLTDSLVSMAGAAFHHENGLNWDTPSMRAAIESVWPANLVRDAQRFAWLRSRCTDQLCVRVQGDNPIHKHLYGYYQVTGKALDTAIDLAMGDAAGEKDCG